ncbi:MAG: hypothetical protein OSB00_07810 [Sphingomonas bacterium]|nr:hypothetical protein [Sphingomonas bacterium]
MSWLKFNPYAYDLAEAVGLVRRGLEAAERAMREDEERVAAEMAENDRKIAAGEVEGPTFDSDGDLLNDPNEGYHYDFMAIKSTQMEVRKSMMIALYHAWERVVRKMTKLTTSKDNHRALATALGAMDIPVSPEVENLRRLVNLVKHNSKEKMLKLWEVRPDLFYRGFEPEVHFPDDWSDTIELSSEQMAVFFDAVIASGPTHEHPREAYGRADS